MAQDIVTASFIKWIQQEIYKDRLENYTTYDNYYNGEHEYNPPQAIKEALESKLGTVTNFCPVIVDTPPEYITGGGEIGIECRKPDGTPYPEAENIFYQIYDNNEFLFKEIITLLTQYGNFGDAFIRLYIENDDIRLSVDRPEQVLPRYMSSDYKRMMWCAYQWFDRSVEDETVMLKAKAFYPDRVETFDNVKESEQMVSMLWQSPKTSFTLVKQEKNPLGFIPIIHMRNNNSLGLEFGLSDLHKVTPIQDNINKTITDMMLVMDNQAFQRIVMFGGSPNQKDIYMGPGSVIQIPNEQGHMMVIPSETIAPFLMALEEQIDLLCAITSIPRLTFMRPTGFPVSGFALRIHSYPLDRKCVRKQLDLERALKTLNKYIAVALAVITGVDMKSANPSFGISKDGKIDIRDAVSKFHFQGGLPVDDAMDTQINAMKINNGTQSKHTTMEKQGVENIGEEMMRISGERWQQFAEQMRMQAVQYGLQDAVEKMLAEQEALRQKQEESGNG